MAEILAGRATSMRLEPPGPEGDGAEFWLLKSGKREYHQVKRQNGASGHWTIAELFSKDVLQHFWEKLHNSTNICIFVSTHAAFQIQELSERAQSAQSFDEFSNEFLKSRPQNDAFVDLCSRWNCLGQVAFSVLKRIYVYTVGEEFLRSSIEREIESLIDDNASNIVDILAQFALNNIHIELHKDDILSHLESRGFHYRFNRDYHLSFGDFSHPSPQFFVGRGDVLEELHNAIQSHNTIILGGLAGIGKTYFAAKFIEKSSENYKALWFDCTSYGQLEQAIVRASKFFDHEFRDNKLIRSLQSPFIRSADILGIITSLMDQYKCLLVFDNFDHRTNHSLMSLFEYANRHSRIGRVFIITREFFDISHLFNLPYRISLSRLPLTDGIYLMRHYLSLLGLPEQLEDILVQAYNRVDGHPYFLRLLIVLSKDLPLPELLVTLPQFVHEAQSYIQKQIFDRLDPASGILLQRLSILRIPFQITAAKYLYPFENSYTSFDLLSKKFLIDKPSKDSHYYDIHTLVKEYGLSLISPEESVLFHNLAAKYYESVVERTYAEQQEIAHHFIEAGDLEQAKEATNTLLGFALYAGLFDFIIEYTNHLSDDLRTSKWGFPFFAQGRALRFKERISEALTAYRKALSSSDSTRVTEGAKMEIAGMLIKQSADSRDPKWQEAKRLYKELTSSKDISNRLSSLGALAYLVLQSGDVHRAISQFNKALALSEKAGLDRNTAELYQGLGQSYSQIDRAKAIEYFEKAHNIRERIREEVGQQDIEANYYLFDALAKLYTEVGRFSKAALCSKQCVEIDRQLQVPERLAHSLYQLGRDLCLSGQYQDSIDAFRESLSTIGKHNIDESKKIRVLEWYAVSLWRIAKFEKSIEIILEFMLINQNNGISDIRHITIEEKNITTDLPPPIVNMGGNQVHLLVLPKRYTLQQINAWVSSIIRKRPELANVYNPILLQSSDLLY